MIPKIIHYCWFGGKPLPAKVENMITTWKKHCPDYEIKQWNENNFDVYQNRYCREAYESEKWAFVSDYARLKVLFDYGGIYMDTDVEVVKPFDDFLDYNAWLSFQSENQLATCVIASAKGNEWIELLLEKYEYFRFVGDHGSYNMMTNVDLITQITKDRYEIKFDKSCQIFGDNNAIFPFEYFCAKDMITEKYFITENTYAIHHFTGTWMDWKRRLKTRVRILLTVLFGRQFVVCLKNVHIKKFL